ncbi:MAG: hypothetical protein RL199_2194, partial [Pseudomonadota bacterium]
MLSLRGSVPSLLALLALIGLACSGTPALRVDRVSPTELASALGGRLVVDGDGLDGVAEARLVSEVAT